LSLKRGWIELKKIDSQKIDSQKAGQTIEKARPFADERTHAQK
jgi:hypothetical protein